LEQGIKKFIKDCLLQDKKKFFYSYYSSELKKLVGVNNTVIKKKGNVFTIEAIHDAAPKSPIIEIRNKTGDLVKQTIPVLHMVKKSVNLNQQSKYTKNIFDIHELSTIKAINYPDIPHDNISNICYSIHFDGNINLMENNRQLIIKKGKSDILISIYRDGYLSSFEQNCMYSRDINSKEYLKDNNFLNINNRLIKAIIYDLRSRNFKKNSLINGIQDWVFNNIETKSLQMHFNTALEILNTREGDCSEHAIISISLFRAAGIPAKLSYGVVFYEGSFWNHFWIEVFLEKKGWISFDTTEKRGKIDIRYIKFGDTSLNDITKAELGLMIAKNLNIKTIEVVSYEKD